MKCFLKHKWSKWKVVDKGEVMSKGNMFYEFSRWEPVGNFIIQQRTCEICGKTQIDKQQVTI